MSKTSITVTVNLPSEDFEINWDKYTDAPMYIRLACLAKDLEEEYPLASSFVIVVTK